MMTEKEHIIQNTLAKISGIDYRQKHSCRGIINSLYQLVPECAGGELGQVGGQAADKRRRSRGREAGVLGREAGACQEQEERVYGQETGAVL